ncbi:hypothetical protein FOA52_012617 [Chlamydomonas sp. UWO 241]|nr:hypothetical protein FOA52_012617 [Chlamydomonas sp. UWO 241]
MDVEFGCLYYFCLLPNTPATGTTGGWRCRGREQGDRDRPLPSAECGMQCVYTYKDRALGEDDPTSDEYI